MSDSEFDGRVCESCKEVHDADDMIWGPDPYHFEVKDDNTAVWLCKLCYQESWEST